MLRISRPLTIAAAAAALFAHPTFARAHTLTAHRPIARGHHPGSAALRYRQSLAFHHRFARVYWRRRVYAYAPRSEANDFSAPWQSGGFGAQGFGTEGFGAQGFGYDSPLQGMAEAAASANGVPASLVDRVIRRESGGNARAASRGNFGLMQIRLGTARAMGYAGSAAGLLDPQTNLTYAVRYLAGAYRAADGNENRAVALYARGYHAARLQHAFNSAPQMQGDEGWQPAGAYGWYGGYAPTARPVHRRRYAL